MVGWRAVADDDGLAGGRGRVEVVPAEAGEAETLAGGAGDDVLGVARYVEEDVHSGRDAGDLDLGSADREQFDQAVPTPAVVQARAPDVPVVVAGGNEWLV